MKQFKLTKYERWALKSYEVGQFVPVDNLARAKRQARQIARNIMNLSGKKLVRE